jgi:hypothetical protein
MFAWIDCWESLSFDALEIKSAAEGWVSAFNYGSPSACTFCSSFASSPVASPSVGGLSTAPSPFYSSLTSASVFTDNILARSARLYVASKLVRKWLMASCSPLVKLIALNCFQSMTLLLAQTS